MIKKTTLDEGVFLAFPIRTPAAISDDGLCDATAQIDPAPAHSETFHRMVCVDIGLATSARRTRIQLGKLTVTKIP